MLYFLSSILFSSTILYISTRAHIATEAGIQAGVMPGSAYFRLQYDAAKIS